MAEVTFRVAARNPGAARMRGLAKAKADPSFDPDRVTRVERIGPHAPGVYWVTVAGQRLSESELRVLDGNR